MTVPAPGGNTDFVDGSRLLLGHALRTPVHEGLGTGVSVVNGFSRTGYKVMRSLPHALFTAQARITNAVDRATSRCPAIPLSRGAQHKQPKPNVCGLGRKEVFQGMRKSSVEQHHLSLWHMPSTQTPTSTARRRLLFHR